MFDEKAMMIEELLWCLSLFFMVFIIQALAHAHIMRRTHKKHTRINAKAGGHRDTLFLAQIMGIIVIVHLVNITIWAVLYLATGAIDTFDKALYFSMSNYTALGCDDIVLTGKWHLMGPFEALSGIIMFSWSVSFFYSINTLLLRNTLNIKTQKV